MYNSHVKARLKFATLQVLKKYLGPKKIGPRGGEPRMVKNWVKKVDSKYYQKWACPILEGTKQADNTPVEIERKGYGKWKVYENGEFQYIVRNKEKARRYAIYLMEGTNYHSSKLEEGKLTKQRIQMDYLCD